MLGPLFYGEDIFDYTHPPINAREICLYSESGRCLELILEGDRALLKIDGRRLPEFTREKNDTFSCQDGGKLCLTKTSGRIREALIEGFSDTELHFEGLPKNEKFYDRAAI